jgi:acyl carrier protein
MEATSVQWGAWAGAGMATNDASTASRVERTGMALLVPEQGLGTLGGLLVGSRRAAAPSVLAANAFAWGKFLKRFGNAVPPLFSAFAAEAAEGQEAGAVAAGASAGRRSGAARVTGLTAADRKAAVAAQVQEAISSIVGGSVSPDEPLMAAGLDSLGAVELKNSLEGRLGVQLPGTLVFDYPTASALTGYLEEVLPADESEASGATDDDDASSVASATAMVPGGLEAVSPHTQNSVVVVLGVSSRSASDAVLSMAPTDAISVVPLDHWNVDLLNRGANLPARFGGFLTGRCVQSTKFGEGWCVCVRVRACVCVCVRVCACVCVWGGHGRWIGQCKACQNINDEACFH